jgi:hypothetical protein
MLGIPLVPVHRFPQSAPVTFLPAQAAADPDLQEHVRKAMAQGTHVIITTSLLIALPRAAELARLVGVDPNLRSFPTRAACTTAAGEVTVDLETPLETTAHPGDVVCTAGGKTLLLLRTVSTPDGKISLLNAHTYSQADFDAVGEVLLCPRPLGLLSLEGPPLAALRRAFRGATGPVFDSPSGVTFHPFSAMGEAGFVVQNFNAHEASVTVGMRNLTVPARGRVWVQEVQRKTPSP